MTSDRWERAAEIFQEALACEVSERRRYVEQACGADAELREEVQSLLTHDARMDDSFMRPLELSCATTAVDNPDTALPDAATDVGRLERRESITPIEGYDIVREIHRGGQGVVYEAVQKSTMRKVAVKVMREGPFVGPADKARFEREVQVLGQLQHPNIVTIHDSGLTAGSYYFVMDYIHGLPLDAYMAGAAESPSDEHGKGNGRRSGGPGKPEIRGVGSTAESSTEGKPRRNAEPRPGLSVRRTLELFAQICDAVNAAHLRGVIHRDLKPGNICVDDGGQPHVLDFGLAKLPSSEQDVLAMTMTGQFIGSLPWASPEQAEGSPGKIDVRTDVYSLGLILYHMLTKRFPYEVVGNMRDVLDRIMRAEPARPSATRRQVDDEVETIVLKCLSKERERRYQSAGELGRDIRHYLDGDPIEAKRDSTLYVLRKQMRRYRLALVVAAAFVFAVTAGFGTSLAFWREAVQEAKNAQFAEAEQRRERERADEQAELAGAEATRATKARERAEAIVDFVTNALVSSDPNQGGRQGLLVTAAMEQAIGMLDAGELRNQPEMEAALLLTISRILNGNARSEDALRLAERALEINRVLHDADNPDVAQSLSGVSSCLSSLGRLDEALVNAQAALAMSQRLHAGDHPDVAKGLNGVAFVLRSLGRSDEALPEFEAALEMRQRLHSGDHLDVAQSLGNLASCLDSLGRSHEALPKIEAALEMQQRLYEGDHPDIANSLNGVGYCLDSLGRPADALPKYTSALEMYQRMFPGDHTDVAMCLNNVGSCLESLGFLDEALPNYEAAVEMVERLFPANHPQVAVCLNNLAGCLESLGRPDEALRRYRVALRMMQSVYGGDHPDVAMALNNIAYSLNSMGRNDEALAEFEAALEMRQRIFAGDHPDVAQGLNNVSACLRSLGRPAEALPLAEEALQMYERLFGEDHPSVAQGNYGLAVCLRSLDLPSKALPRFEVALDIFRRNLPAGHLRILYPQIGKAGTLAMIGRFADAERLLLDAAEQCDRSDACHRTHWRSVVEESIRLYDAWHAAAPEKGFDVKSAEWREKLALLDAAAGDRAKEKEPGQSAPSSGD